jgi:hypothetical protein
LTAPGWAGHYEPMNRMARALTTVSLFLIILGAAMAEELRSFHGRVVRINGLTMALRS